MKDFFSTIFELLGLYGDALGEHLYGWNGEDYSGSATYIPTGMFMLISAFVMMGIYYYVVNHPRFNRWYHWLLSGVILMAINFGVSFLILNTEYQTYVIDPELLERISPADLYLYALTVSIWALVAYTISSFMFRWWSSNCRRTPIPL